MASLYKLIWFSPICLLVFYLFRFYLYLKAISLITVLRILKLAGSDRVPGLIFSIEYFVNCYETDIFEVQVRE